ncbi:cytochrome b [uncultured Ruegeria sp.]|uniref:cytochrome b n=1 Tax=uncultured Ruegeria sp. TaxID=259304 RepID=UPI0026080D58|nr:cytochrome b [uncultured Ruegeria sp.]
MTQKLKYRQFARFTHWAMAVLVIGMLVIGFLMIQEAVGRSMKNFLFITHKNVGVLLLMLIAARIAYRWLHPPRLSPVELPAMQKLAARLTHIGLYGFLLIMPLTGYIRVRAGGFPIEALDKLGIPAFVPRSNELADAAKVIHFYGSYAIAGLILAHLSAAAFHGIVRQDGIFSRMWPPIGK